MEHLLGKRCDARNREQGRGREMSNASSFVLRRVAKMARIIIASPLTLIDHFLYSRLYSEDSTRIMLLAFLPHNNATREVLFESPF